MKAITLEAPKQFRAIDIAAPDSPGEGEALVRTHCMGVCGTDVSAYLGKFPFFDYPRIPGHELGVEVLEVGANVTNVQPGDRCSVEPYLNCGKCYACRKGSTNCCETLSVIGVMENGGLCDQFVIRADKLHPSKTLEFEQLALVETLGIGSHAVQRGGPTSQDRVLIIGVGPIGLSTLEFVKLTGAEVTVMDQDAARLQFCRDHYQVAETIQFKGDGSEVERVREITGGEKYAVVFDATGNPHSMAGAIQHVAHTGTLVFVGITTTPLAINQPEMHRPEITIKSSRNALPADFVEIIQRIEAGDIDTKPWITHRVDFDDVVEAFEALTLPASKVIKAMIHLGASVRNS